MADIPTFNPLAGQNMINKQFSSFLKHVGMWMYNSITGFWQPIQDDGNGDVLVALGSLLFGENQAYGRIMTLPNYNYQNITTQTTTIIKGSSGFFHGIMINTPVASSVITIYDNTSGSGTKIGTITLPGTLLNDGPIPVFFDCPFSNGLAIVTGTASSDITALYL